MDLKRIGANFEIHLKSEKGIGSMRVTGDAVSLLTGLETLIQQLHKSGIPKEKIEKTVELAFMTEKEKEEMLEKKKAEMKKDLNEILEKIFK